MPVRRGDHHRLHLTPAVPHDQPDQPDHAVVGVLGDPDPAQIQPGQIFLELRPVVGSAGGGAIHAVVLKRQLGIETAAGAVVARPVRSTGTGLMPTFDSDSDPEPEVRKSVIWPTGDTQPQNIPAFLTHRASGDPGRAAMWQHPADLGDGTSLLTRPAVRAAAGGSRG